MEVVEGDRNRGRRWEEVIEVVEAVVEGRWLLGRIGRGNRREWG